MPPTLLDIAGHRIGSDHPCFIIAEAGVNHNGSLEMVRQLVDVAVRAGASAIKFQTFRAEKLVSAQAPKAHYQHQTTDAGESQLTMLKRLELSFDAFRALSAYCHDEGLLFLSTPFDDESADFLDDLGVAAFKIPSGEVTNLPFLTHVAQKGKPLIVSTGMAHLGEVDPAMRTIPATGNRDVVLLHRVSNYPADPAESNLRAMATIAAAFVVPTICCLVGPVQRNGMPWRRIGFSLLRRSVFARIGYASAETIRVDELLLFCHNTTDFFSKNSSQISAWRC
jgi:N,N'-diacetyllegionaminate synthase